MKQVIDYINKQLSSLAFKRFGLCEQLSEGDKKYPAFFDGLEYRHVSDYDFTEGLIYHRFRGDITFEEEDEENTVSCGQYYRMTYPIRLVFVKKGRSGLHIPVSKKIKATKELRGLIGIELEISIEAVKTDREELFNEEYEGIEGLISFEYEYFAIDYNLVLIASLKCFSDCSDDVVTSFDFNSYG
jgi:hypothetical protein